MRSRAYGLNFTMRIRLGEDEVCIRSSKELGSPLVDSDPRVSTYYERFPPNGPVAAGSTRPPASHAASGHANTRGELELDV